jgi:PAS domain S-box-containing protein
MLMLTGRGSYDVDVEAARLGVTYLVKGRLDPAPLERSIRLAAQTQQTLRALRESEERYRRIVETAREGVWTIDAQGGTTFVNQTMADMLGYTVEEMLRRPLRDFVRDEDWAAAESHDVRFRRKDGGDLWALLSTSPLGEHGAPAAGKLAMVTDITERRRAESRFRAFLEFAPDAVVTVDVDGRLVLVNAQTERLFGYGRDELIGRPVETLLPERFREAHTGHRAAYAQDPRPRSMGAGLELYGRRADGSEFPVDVSLSPLETGEEVLLAATIRDVSERKRLEGLRDEFISNAAHELRTPLAALAGLSETLARHMADMTDEQIDQCLGALMRQGERASVLVSNLLDLSRIERARDQPEPGPVDVAATITRALDVAPPPEGSTVDVRLRNGAAALADSSRLEQVVVNLLTMPTSTEDRTWRSRPPRPATPCC